jgi:hypothetical protein
MSASPGNHPLPPQNFSEIHLPTKNIPPRTSLYRIHPCRRDPIYYNSTKDYRFNSPDGSYGVLYVGEDRLVAFRETIVRDYPFIDCEPSAKLAQSCISELETIGQLTLANLTGQYLSHIRADARLLTCDYEVSQKWSQAIQQHHQKVDGLYYHSRFDPSRFCIAIFENKPAIAWTKSVPLSLVSPEYRSCLWEAIDTYRCGVINDRMLPPI